MTAVCWSGKPELPTDIDTRSINSSESVSWRCISRRQGGGGMNSGSRARTRQNRRQPLFMWLVFCLLLRHVPWHAAHRQVVRGETSMGSSLASLIGVRRRPLRWRFIGGGGGSGGDVHGRFFQQSWHEHQYNHAGAQTSAFQLARTVLCVLSLSVGRSGFGSSQFSRYLYGTVICLVSIAGQVHVHTCVLSSVCVDAE